MRLQSPRLAQVYLVTGQLRDAIAAGERALSIFEARGNRWWAGRTLWHLSSAANFLGRMGGQRRAIAAVGSSTALPSTTFALRRSDGRAWD